MTLTIEEAKAREDALKKQRKQIEQELRDLRFITKRPSAPSPYRIYCAEADKRVLQVSPDGKRNKATRLWLTEDVKWDLHIRSLYHLTADDLPRVLEYVKNWRK